MDTQNRPGPVVFTIFGGAGDLTWRKLIPSLFNLHLNRSLPDKFTIFGVDRAALSDETLRKRLREGVRQFSNLGLIKAADWKAFAAHISYQRADLAAAKTYTTENCAGGDVVEFTFSGNKISAGKAEIIQSLSADQSNGATAM
ncbi:MAG: hypothetical protein IT579_20910 [Verrucomicrobia subdivision 3 bacterium]|nr:hypothetical protein [Limisphaerales bacterium]